MKSDKTTARPLIGPDEPGPFEREDRAGPLPVIVVCDHGGNRIPGRLGTLGIAPHHLDDHIAWDIGAAAVAARLAERLQASQIIANYSRLVVDLNRSLRDPSAFPAISDGVLVPGNLQLPVAARDERIASIYAPYHAEVDRLIARMSGDDIVPVMIAVHSFTPRISGVARPWQVGILWDKDPRLAFRLMQGLRADPQIFVGDNEPYSGRHIADYTIDYHAEVNRIAHAAIEIRQDLIDSEAGQVQWAERLANVLLPLLEDESLYRRLGRPHRTAQ